MTSRRRDLGELSPRLLQLSAKTNPVEPYPVTDKIEIRQTRKRRDDVHETYNEIVSCQQKLTEMVRRANALPRPELPDDPTADQAAAHDDELAAWQAQIDAMDKAADELTSRANAAGERYNRAFFGDAHDDIMALTEDWDPALFDEFKADVNAHFQQNVNAPADGRNDAGELVDAAEAVEAGKSPT